MFKFVSYFVMTDIQQNPQWNRRWRAVSVVSIGSVMNSVVIVSLRAVESPKNKSWLECTLESQSWRARVEESELKSQGYAHSSLVSPSSVQSHFPAHALVPCPSGKFSTASRATEIMDWKNGLLTYFYPVFRHSTSLLDIKWEEFPVLLTSQSIGTGPIVMMRDDYLYDTGAPIYDIGDVLYDIRPPIYYIGCAVYK